MTSNLSYWLEILVMLGGILLACQIFTNAIENLGDKLNLNHEFTGSILAAVGTALPETILPLVAIYMASQTHAAGAAAKNDIAIGAIVGAPFMLTTLAMLLLGLSIYVHRTKRAKIIEGKFGADELEEKSQTLLVNANHLKRDLKYFLVIFSMAIFATFFATNYVSQAIDSFCGTSWGFEITKFIDIAINGKFDGSLIPVHCHDDIGYILKIVTAVTIISLYISYLIDTYYASQDEIGDEEDDTPELYMKTITKGKLSDGMVSVIFQTLIGLAGIIYFAHHFVDSVDHIAQMTSISPLVLSLIVSPIATELPEKVNSWIWSSEAKDTLAMGNLSGAMVFQATIPCVIGILMTPWELNNQVFLCSALAIIGSLILLFQISTSKKIGYKTLLITGSLYLIYLLLIFRV